MVNALTGWTGARDERSPARRHAESGEGTDTRSRATYRRQRRSELSSPSPHPARVGRPIRLTGFVRFCRYEYVVHIQGAIMEEFSARRKRLFLAFSPWVMLLVTGCCHLPGKRGQQDNCCNSCPNYTCYQAVHTSYQPCTPSNACSQVTSCACSSPSAPLTSEITPHSHVNTSQHDVEASDAPLPPF